MLNKLPSTLKGEVDVGTDILLAKELVEARLMEHSLNRGVHAREYHLDALTLRHETEVCEVVDACGVDKRHLTHADDTDTGFQTLMAQGTHDLLETVTGAEEVRAVDLIHLHTFGDREVFEVTQLEVAVFLLRIDLL